LRGLQKGEEIKLGLYSHLLKIAEYLKKVYTDEGGSWQA